MHARDGVHQNPVVRLPHGQTNECDVLQGTAGTAVEGLNELTLEGCGEARVQQQHIHGGESDQVAEEGGQMWRSGRQPFMFLPAARFEVQYSAWIEKRVPLLRRVQPSNQVANSSTLSEDTV